MNNYILHKLPERFIVTSNEKIQNNELYYVWGGIGKAIGIYTKKESDETNNDWCKKVIAQQDQITFSNEIPEDKLKEIGWLDWFYYWGNLNTKLKNVGGVNAFGYEKGFQKAQELLSDRMFTLEEVKAAFRKGFTQRNEAKPNAMGDFLQSIQNKSWKIEIEMGQENLGKVFNGKSSNIMWGDLKPKLTNGKIKIAKIL
jgi:hypothetical protein